MFPGIYILIKETDIHFIGDLSGGDHLQYLKSKFWTYCGRGFLYINPYIPGPFSLGAKWFLKGVNSPSPWGFHWHSLEGVGVVNKWDMRTFGIFTNPWMVELWQRKIYHTWILVPRMLSWNLLVEFGVPETSGHPDIFGARFPNFPRAMITAMSSWEFGASAVTRWCRCCFIFGDRFPSFGHLFYHHVSNLDQFGA